MVWAFKISKAQKMNYAYVDSLSYQLYLRNSTDSLEQLTNTANEKEIDFYYLQLRTGILVYNQRMYQKAEKYFERSLAYNTEDPLTLEYLYYCNIYNSKFMQAEALSEKFSPSLKDKLKIQPGKQIEAISIETGGLITDHSTDRKDIKGDAGIYGEYDRSNYFYYSKIGVLSKISPRFKLYNSIGFLNLDKLNSYQAIPNKNGSSAYQTKQYDVFSHLSYLHSSNILYTAAYHYMMNTSNDQKVNYNKKESNYFFTTETLKIPLHAASVGMTYFMRSTQLKTSISACLVNNDFIKQANVGLNYNLGANKRIYLSTSAGLFNLNKVTKVIVQQKIGTFFTPKLRGDINFTFGQLSNYIDEDAASIYYMTDNVLFKTGPSLTYSFNSKICMSLSSEILTRETQYYYYKQAENYYKRATFQYPSYFASFKMIWKL